MAQSRISIILALQLCLIQGIKSQQWGIKMSQSDICAVTGSSVVMPCTFTHPPDVSNIKVFWVIDPEKGIEPLDLSETPEYRGRARYSADTGKDCTLVLNQVKPTDAHMYRARLTSSKTKDKWISKPVRLLVTDLTVQIGEPVIEGQDAELSCTSSCSLTNSPNLVWRRNGNVLSGKQTDNKNKKLFLKRIRIEDEGQYSCEVQDSVEHPSKTGEAEVSPKNTTLSIIPSSAILKGSSVNLLCSSVASPPVESYTWFKVDESTPVGSGQQYSITNISSEDGGQYYCEARNEYGAENSTAVSITVKEDNTLMMFVVIGVSPAVGIMAVFCIAFFIRKRFQGRAENPEDRSRQNAESARTNKGPQHDYEISTHHSSDELDSVYQNYKPDATGNDDDDIYQNV